MPQLCASNAASVKFLVIFDRNVKYLTVKKGGS